MPEAPTPPAPPALDRWLDLAAAHLSPVLVAPPVLRRLAAAARRLPVDCRGVLEVRLAAGEPAVDLSVRLDRGGQIPAAFAAPDSGTPSDTGRFLARWAAAGSRLPVWLEFDLGRPIAGPAADPAADLPDPVLCAQLPAGVEAGELVDGLLPLLHGGPLGAARRARGLACVRLLPPAARLLYAFSLRARGEDAVRLEISGLSAGEIEDYLGRVGVGRPGEDSGWPAVAAVLGDMENLHLSFDLGAQGEILPRLGLEGAFARQPAREPRWQAVLGSVVRRGLGAAGKCDALLAWPGYDSFWTAPGRWPADAAGMAGAGVRFLSHLKGVARPGRSPEVKAYLGFGYRRVVRGPS